MINFSFFHQLGYLFLMSEFSVRSGSLLLSWVLFSIYYTLLDFRQKILIFLSFMMIQTVSNFFLLLDCLINKDRNDVKISLSIFIILQAIVNIIFLCNLYRYYTILIIIPHYFLHQNKKSKISTLIYFLKNNFLIFVAFAFLYPFYGLRWNTYSVVVFALQLCFTIVCIKSLKYLVYPSFDKCKTFRSDDLFIACVQNDLNKAQAIWRCGVKLEKDNLGSECLRQACLDGNFETVKFLVEIGCPIDDYHVIPACREGHLEIIKYFIIEQDCLNKPCIDKITWDDCIIAAIKFKHVNCIVWMLHNGTITVPYESLLKKYEVYNEVKEIMQSKSSRK